MRPESERSSTILPTACPWMIKAPRTGWVVGTPKYRNRASTLPRYRQFEAMILFSFVIFVLLPGIFLFFDLLDAL